MRTAILISGHMRSFDRCLPTLHWHVFRHFPEADFFVSTEPDEDAQKADLLREQYPQCQVSIDTTPQPDVVTELGEKLPSNSSAARELRIAGLQVAAQHAPYAISVPVEAVLGQLWRLQRCWETLPPDHDYHVYIRCRPDL